MAPMLPCRCYKLRQLSPDTNLKRIAARLYFCKRQVEQKCSNIESTYNYN